MRAVASGPRRIPHHRQVSVSRMQLAQCLPGRCECLVLREQTFYTALTAVGRRRVPGSSTDRRSGLGAASAHRVYLFGRQGEARTRDTFDTGGDVWTCGANASAIATFSARCWVREP